jgi:nucleotide-binding universal stress UspA family protein
MSATRALESDPRRCDAQRPRVVVVPLDGSERSSRALPVARRWAGAFGAEVVALSTSANAGRRVPRWLSDLVGHAAPPVRAVVSTASDPVQAIAEAVRATPRSAVCMSTHAYAPAVDTVLGEVARRVQRAVDVPVVLVGPHCAEAELDGPVVLAHDGSAGEPSALRAAAVWSAARQQPAVVLHVRAVFEPTDDSRVATELRAARDALGPAARIETVRSAFVAGAIREFVRESDACLLALGTSGATDALTAAAGRTATWLIRECPCPVLTMHPAAAVRAPA